MSEILAQLEKKGGGSGNLATRMNVVLAAYYNVDSSVEFGNVGWTSATLTCTGPGTTSYWRLVLYGDGILLGTATYGQTPLTVDVTQYSKLKVTVPEGGNNFRGYLDLS